MAKLSEILDEEKKRTTPLLQRQIRLWSDGSFYRAYEWSAWLCVRYIRQFKVTRRPIKSVGTDMLFVGFPKSSLEKFEVEGTQVSETEDGGVVLTLPESLVHPDREDSTLEAEYDNWKQTIPAAKSTENTNEKSVQTASSSGQPMSLTGIMRQFLGYQIENHSPIECMLFMIDIKQKLSALL